MNPEPATNTTATRTTAATVRAKIEDGGERVWRLADFAGLPGTAVAQTLSRLTRRGTIERLGKGLYYRSRPTALGPSRPNPAQIRALTVFGKTVFPAGVAAANLLGLTTQNAARIELATPCLSLPRLLVGRDAIVHTRRPAAWTTLTEIDAALLDVLRNRGGFSELTPEDTVAKLLGFIREFGRIERLLAAAPSEPPRIRAMLGAVGQQIGQPRHQLDPLRKSLNPLSRFDFGVLAALAYSKEWQAKERKAREAL